MPDTHVKFHSSNGKRQLLAIEDELINLEILKTILADNYEVLTAQTGAEAVEKIYANKDTLSLILLDLHLPDANGLDILRQIRGDHRLTRIPVIVMTSDREAEADSLTEGAIDFIAKPYPMPKVILARVLRNIELSEDRDIIRSTERDSLTGLYNKEYFFSYAAQFDVYHRDMLMDAMVVNINHFHMINERYGRAYGDSVLQRVGSKLRESVAASGGIVCRRESDSFLVYCPHRTDYAEILENAGSGLDGRVRLRMGVYAQVDKNLEMERRFDRAKLAADKLRNNFNKTIALYDDALHESEILAEQLLEDFEKALEQKQFKVYYQPKFDIRPSTPILYSAEALVRWEHPKLGLLNPISFVPLFETNGLIQQLDHYVWREAASHMRDWKDRLRICVPVSVNVSRVDVLDADLLNRMQSLLEEFGLTHDEFLLEITESAYTQDSEQIVKTVRQLRQAGFRIEMDDFGSGYSSLNMISSLPVDAIKLDMQFIRNAFREHRNTRLLDVVLDIADSLQVPTIAEGVETAEQMFTLKAMGCDYVQGYYLSRPLPADEYEAFLLSRKETAEEQVEKKRRDKSAGQLTYNALHDPQTGLYNYSAYDVLLRDADKEHIALLIAGIDDYGRIQAEQGQEIADKVVVRVAEVLRHHFRSVDYVCRISDDEFVVMMTRMSSAMRKLVTDKVELINDTLQEPEEGLPLITLSVGVAFADREHPQGDIFQDADTALYRMKEMKRCGCAIF